MSGVGSLKGYAIAVGTLAAIVLVTIAVITGFKDPGIVDNSAAYNAVADSFITGLTIFATFVGVIILAIVGKIIVGLFAND